MNEIRKCGNCNQKKSLAEHFYCYQGRYRSQCKKCTIRKNALHQKETQAWKRKTEDGTDRRAYYNRYYAENKAKFAEYRSEFKERHPGYYKEYHRKRREEKRGAMTAPLNQQYIGLTINPLKSTINL